MHYLGLLLVNGKMVRLNIVFGRLFRSPDVNLSQDDIQYLSDQKGRLLRRFWLATFCGLFASWVWLIALFGLFAISEFWKMQRLFRIPTEEDGSSNTYEIGRSIGRALFAVVCAYIPVFILGSLIKLIKDYIWSLLK